MLERNVQYLKIVPALDSIRGIAVMMVIYSHVFLQNTPDAVLFFFFTGKRFQQKQIISWSEIGVELFFVLSGFLITKILILERIKLKQGQASFLKIFRKFILRRILRIWPVYIATVLILVLAGNKVVSQTLVFNLTFTINYFLAYKNSFYGEVGHLWSLAVEYQFYLVWPILILLSKKIKEYIYPMILISPTFYLIGNLVGTNPVALRVAFFGTFSFFIGGAIVAFYRPKAILVRISAFIFLSLIVLNLFDLISDRSLIPRMLLLIVKPILFGWFVYRTYIGWGNFVDKILNFKFLIILGEVSYGLYLFHYFILAYLPQIYSYLGLQIKPEFQLFLNFAVITLGSFILAYLSRYTLEKFFLGLKERFAK